MHQTLEYMPPRNDPRHTGTAAEAAEAEGKVSEAPAVENSDDAALLLKVRRVRGVAGRVRG